MVAEGPTNLFPIDKVEPPIPLNPDISGLQPTVLRKRICGGGSIMPVSKADLWSPDLEFAGVSVCHFDSIFVHQPAARIWKELADASCPVTNF